MSNMATGAGRIACACNTKHLDDVDENEDLLLLLFSIIPLGPGGRFNGQA